jgi:hypothetical protein
MPIPLFEAILVAVLRLITFWNVLAILLLLFGSDLHLIVSMILDGNQMKECGRGFGYEDFWVVFFIRERKRGFGDCNK